MSSALHSRVSAEASAQTAKRLEAPAVSSSTSRETEAVPPATSVPSGSFEENTPPAKTGRSHETVQRSPSASRISGTSRRPRSGVAEDAMERISGGVLCAVRFTVTGTPATGPPSA